MDNNEMCDLLNACGKSQYPDLKLSFLPHFNQPMIKVSHIVIIEQVAFDAKEVEAAIKDKNLTQFFIKRVDKALSNISKKANSSIHNISKEN